VTNVGLFDHHESAPRPAEFMGLVLDAEALQTPAGSMPLGDITRAEFVRQIVPDGNGPEETSTAAVLGGAIVGAALFGGVGAVAGGLVGSTVKEGGPENFKTQSVHLVFETDSLDYAVDVPRDQEYAAVDFVDAVKHAVKHHKE
jgi:outer membrane lipoprotein SlyB